MSVDVKTESSGVFAFVLFLKINPDDELLTVVFCLYLVVFVCRTLTIFYMLLQL